jgi:hypothetical protein
MSPLYVSLRRIVRAEVQTYLSLTSALDGVIEQHQDQVALHPGKKPATDLKGDFGPQDRPGGSEEGKSRI